MFFIRKFREAKNDWQNKSPKQKWTSLYDVTKTITILVQDRFLTDYYIGIVSYFAFFAMTFHSILLVYTFYHNTKRDQFIDFLPCLCISGVCIGVSR